MGICTYCGAPADSLDHVVPYSWNHTKRRTNGKGKAGHGLKVLCCRECNSLLGNVLLHTIEDRRAYIAEKLTQRTKQLVPWSREELDELGPSLRGMIEDKQASIAKDKARVANASK